MPRSDINATSSDPTDNSYEELALWERGRIRLRMNFRKLLQREVLAVSRHLRDVVNDEEYHGNLQALLPSVVRKQHEAEIKATVIGHLMQIEGIGPVLAERLYDEFGSLEAIVQATPERLMLVEGIGEVRLQTIPEDVRVLMRKLRSQ